MKNYRKIFTGFLAAAMLFSAVPMTNAASSSELEGEINALRQKQDAIASQMAALKAQENANWSSTEDMVNQKNNIDQQMFLLYAQLDNLEDQIMEYGQLIAQNQQELDQAQKRLADLNEKNKDRIRAMEEEGKVSYWSVVFQANSFTDLVDRLSMVSEIAAADERMLAELDAAAKEVARVQEDLVNQKTALEQSREDQVAAQDELEQKRAEADDILNQLNMERADLAADHSALHAEDNELVAEIARTEQAYNEAKAREAEEARKKAEAEAEKKRQEEEQKKQEEEANKKPTQPESKPNETKPNETKPNETKPEETKPEETKPAPKPEETKPNPPAESSWRQPCSYVYISSPYGSRGGGWHNGVDFAASRGTPIYASRSGTVTKARSMTTSYGNHVVINHGDGFSSLYAHMDYFVVSAGEHVSQGQLIGYVGSTGNSTGPHLHFTIMLNGSDVNPMKYL